jgi:spermidine/putrescine-binding protein
MRQSRHQRSNVVSDKCGGIPWPSSAISFERRRSGELRVEVLRAVKYRPIYSHQGRHHPRVIADVTTAVGLANANLKATPLLDPAVSSDPMVYPSAEQIQRLYAVPEYTLEQTRAITRLWQKFKTGQ